MAEEKGLHVVQFSKANGYFPTVLASPSKCRTEEDIETNEILDFKQYCLDGRVILERKKYPPFYTKHKSWDIYLKKQENIRNQDKVRMNLRVEYGEIRSFLTDKYPECRPARFIKKNKESEEEEE
ncbi:hypothetical protein WA026_018686 [Henosepilachna vigintioctopunctata]|uniref:Uncharacterized protein n=1 Tax=Henosepilachna vigintioctopunctata TaxID=420089 RepID=A0AAW1UBZ2_9CUCU